MRRRCGRWRCRRAIDLGRVNGAVRRKPRSRSKIAREEPLMSDVTIAATRRRFMAHFAGIGLGATLAPGVVWARMQDAAADTVTLEMLTDALKLSGIDLSEEDRKAMVDGGVLHAGQIGRAHV